MAKKRRATHAVPVDILGMFRQLNLPTEDRSFSSLFFGPFLDLAAPRQNPGIEYRPVLTNGTGQVALSTHAQLE